MTQPRNVSFLGLGVMGGPIARHLANSGHALTVYNRSPARLEAWLAANPGLSVRVAKSPAEAAEGADVVLTCVGNDDDLSDVVLGPAGVFTRLKRGGLFIDHTTASARIARQIYVEARDKEILCVDAPMTGSQIGAENGTLTVMCGARPEAMAAAEPIFAAYTRRVVHIGKPGYGQLAKMVNQICIAGLVQGLSEAVAFGLQAGLDMPLVLDVIGKGAAQSWQMDNRGKTMVEGRFDFGFAVDWMRKDLGLVLDEAKRNGARLPVTALVDQFYADVQYAGGNRWDTSSLITRLVAPRA